MKIKLSELRKVIKEELQNMTPKLNDDYMGEGITPMMVGGMA